MAIMSLLITPQPVAPRPAFCVAFLSLARGWRGQAARVSAPHTTFHTDEHAVRHSSLSLDARNLRRIELERIDARATGESALWRPGPLIMLAELHEQDGQAHRARVRRAWQATTVLAAAALRLAPANSGALRLDAHATQLFAHANDFLGFG